MKRMKLSASAWAPRLTMIAALALACGCMSGDPPKQSANVADELETEDVEQLKGKVVRIKDVAVTGSDDPTRIVYVDTDDAQRIAVDLGPITGMKDANLKVGDELTARGIVGTFEGDPVFVADEAEIGGRKLTIAGYESEREASQTDPASKDEEPSQEYQFSGKITDQDEVKVAGTSIKHTVAVLQTTEGSKLLLDLGPSGPISSASIGKGSEVGVKGRAVKFNGRPVLVASELTSGEKTLNIVHDDSHAHDMEKK